MARVIALIFLMMLASACSKKQHKLVGHWYVESSDEPMEYLELKFSSDTVFSVLRDGYYWYDQRFEYASDSTLRIKGDRYVLRQLSVDTMLLEVENGKFARFVRLKRSNDPFTEEELALLRRYRYYANSISPFDSNAIYEFGYEIWALMNQRNKEIIPEEDIILSPPEKE